MSQDQLILKFNKAMRKAGVRPVDFSKPFAKTKAVYKLLELYNKNRLAIGQLRELVNILHEIEDVSPVCNRVFPWVALTVEEVIEEHEEEEATKAQ